MIISVTVNEANVFCRDVYVTMVELRIFAELYYVCIFFKFQWE